MRSTSRRGVRFLRVVAVAALVVGAAVGLGGVTVRAVSQGNWQPWQIARIAAAADTPASSALSPVVTAEPNPFFGPDTIANMVDRVRGTVVLIETQSSVSARPFNPFSNDPVFRDFFQDLFPAPGHDRQRTGLGSGVIVSPDGYIVTNQHVIDGADGIEVTVEGHDPPYTAKVVGQDRQTDLAVLKIEPKHPLAHVTFGDASKVRVGEWIVAIGNPYGYDHTVTAGVISATGRPIDIRGRSYRNLLQTDAAINPGNSGGPLLNLAGEVIGINVAIETPNGGSVGIGFAIPAGTVTEIYQQIRENGRVDRPVKAYIGIYMQDIDAQVARALGLDEAQGVLVAGIVGRSPAVRAGLKRYDVILEFDQKPVKDSVELARLVGDKRSGDQVLILIWRDGELKTVVVNLGEAPVEEN